MNGCGGERFAWKPGRAPRVSHGRAGRRGRSRRRPATALGPTVGIARQTTRLVTSSGAEHPEVGVVRLDGQRGSGTAEVRVG